MISAIRFALVRFLLGATPEVDAEAESLYQSIWPKHDDYEKKNRELIYDSLLKMKYGRYM